MKGYIYKLFDGNLTYYGSSTVEKKYVRLSEHFLALVWHIRYFARTFQAPTQALELIRPRPPGLE